MDISVSWCTCEWQQIPARSSFFFFKENKQKKEYGITVKPKELCLSGWSVRYNNQVVGIIIVKAKKWTPHTPFPLGNKRNAIFSTVGNRFCSDLTPSLWRPIRCVILLRWPADARGWHSCHSFNCVTATPPYTVLDEKADRGNGVRSLTYNNLIKIELNHLSATNHCVRETSENALP